ncbi:arylformamidase [Aquabacterium sp. A7-Y]|uniref:arylformamidase n=1 Tax=Aquabacterium sp. A7-Y TaxID=1349605 RepID=UPI00223D0540|nr:arylformamidase [Aquabacterium sp. A7-Y]MCW7536429.1 arylformamidase [Aquabacterium sp. A7-Y]
MKRLWDISPPVYDGSPVFPGDTPYQQRWSARLGPGCPVNVGQLTLSPHVGAHADAPLHYANGAAPAGLLDLQPYLGPCRVVHCIGRGPLIRIEDLQDHVDALPPRVLVRTFEQAPVHRWVDDFAAFAPEALAWLADHGVQLVGIDTASVDPASSKTLDAHQILLQRDLRVLENLVLDDVPAGDYELIALPLKLLQADASPVRAVLREL